MTNDDIIRMACEANVAGVTVYDEQSEADILHPDLEYFAKLIAAANDNKYPIKFTHEEYNAVIDAAVADGVAAEREACAKICNAISTAARKDWKAKYNPHDDGRCDGAFECEEAIRARGQQ